MLFQKSPTVGMNVENMKRGVCSQQNTVYQTKKGEEDFNVNQTSAPHANSNS